MKKLVICFSRKGMNYVNGDIRNLPKGNCRNIAEIIASITDGDLFEVERKKPYPEDYRACVNESVAELKEQARPELKKMLADISEYDMIYIVGPCWCGHYPMPLATQLENLDFDNKKVRYVMSHEGSGLANAKEDLQKWCRNAVIGDGLAVKGTDIGKSVIAEWIRKGE